MNEVDENPYQSPQIPARQPLQRNWRRDILFLAAVAVIAAPVLYGLEFGVLMIFQWWTDPTHPR